MRRIARPLIYIDDRSNLYPMELGIVKRRGRPPKNPSIKNETKEALIRAGMEVLTEKCFTVASIDEILQKVGVPKGSYYYYFSSKAEFGRQLLDRYVAFFANKLRRNLNNTSVAPLARIGEFAADAARGMAKYDFKRGCLVGNMSQEMTTIPEHFADQLRAGYELWQSIVEQCLVEAQESGEIAANADCRKLASVFWSGWEGAVMRARVEQRADPMYAFADFFVAGLPRA